MSASDNDYGKAAASGPALTRAEKIALARETQKERLKEKAKAAKKAYLSRPDVQAKLTAQKEKLAAKRKEQSAAIKAARKAEKTALAAAKKMTRERKQYERDQELVLTLERASTLENKNTPKDLADNGIAEKPMLTVISGGRSIKP